MKSIVVALCNRLPIKWNLLLPSSWRRWFVKSTHPSMSKEASEATKWSSWVLHLVSTWNSAEANKHRLLELGLGRSAGRVNSWEWGIGKVIHFFRRGWDLWWEKTPDALKHKAKELFNNHNNGILLRSKHSDHMWNFYFNCLKRTS